MSKVRAVVLDEKKSVEMGYERAELKSIIEDILNQEVFMNADAISLAKVVGSVEKSEYIDGEGVVVECEIWDEDVTALIEKDQLHIAPSLVVDDFTDYFIKTVDKLFMTPDPEYIVGETEVFNNA